MVVKNDPTLMFTNAGMNQFKDIFLGNDRLQSIHVLPIRRNVFVFQESTTTLKKSAIDTYHHTMFEMLGNWSFR
ncbi:MAG: alanine--tRNA ligase-related protein [Marinilabiliales bacterium]|nr:alanine--tRNA ligase-related protein [Marinilabiliales bacterium]